MEEIWRPVVGYEGFYEVSSLGNLKSVERTVRCNTGVRTLCAQEMKPFLDNGGYLKITLYDKKQFFVHRLVAEAFIPNPDNLPYINHKDECKTNNVCTNLEWCDSKYNNNYGSRTKRSSKKRIGSGKQVIGTDNLGNSVTFKNADIAELFFKGKITGIIYKCISAKYRNKSAYGYQWKYF